MLFLLVYWRQNLLSFDNQLGIDRILPTGGGSLNVINAIRQFIYIDGLVVRVYDGGFWGKCRIQRADPKIDP